MGRAIKMIKSKGRLDNSHLTEVLNMHMIDEEFRFPIEFRNCELDHFISGYVHYLEPVEWNNCIFKQIDLSATYFSKGLTCKDCRFLGLFRWDMGGHNSPDWPILFERVKFHRFADFWDSCFEGPFILRDVEFMDGTNLMNKKFGWVSFDYPPKFERVKGEMDQRRNVLGGGSHGGGVYEQDKDGWWAPTGKKIERPRKRSLLDKILRR